MVDQAQTILLDFQDKMIGAKMARSLAVDAHLNPSTASVYRSFATLHKLGEDSCSECPECFLKFAVMSGLTLYAKPRLRRRQYGKNFFATAAPEMLNMEHFYWEPIAQYLIEYGADSENKSWEPCASIATELSDPNEISSEASPSSETKS